MADPIEFYGTFLAAQLCRTHNNHLTRRIGEPDAIMRRGVKDLGLWKAERVLDYASSGKLWEAPANPLTYYQGWNESARFVGVTERTLKRILGEKQPPAILIPDQAAEPHSLWPEQWLMAIRSLIASGDIEVHRFSLTKPKYGVRITSPRHVLAVDQNRETEQLRKANPLDFVIW